MNVSQSSEAQSLYRRLLDAWNERDAQAMADLFAEDGESIGFDGSVSTGPSDILRHLAPIFRDHPTARYVSKVRSVQALGEDVFLLRAIAGMVPPGKSDLNPNVNTHHTLVAVRNDGQWRIRLFQNTPAQFHGRPELVEQMSEELRQLL